MSSPDPATGPELVLFAAGVPPCRADLERPPLTLCGKNIADGMPITDVQALVFYGDKRCIDCRRVHSIRGLRGTP